MPGFEFDALWDIKAARRLLEEAADPNTPADKALRLTLMANAAATLALAQVQYAVARRQVEIS